MKDPMSLPQRPSMPPVGADVLGRPQPPHNAISFDCGCGPPRTSAPTDSLTFHSCATTNRGARPSACGNATCGIDPDSRLHSRTASTSFQSRDAPAPKASGCPRRSRAAKRSQEAARLGKATGFCVSARRARLDGTTSRRSSAENRAFQRL